MQMRPTESRERVKGGTPLSRSHLLDDLQRDDGGHEAAGVCGHHQQGVLTGINRAGRRAAEVGERIERLRFAFLSR